MGNYVYKNLSMLELEVTKATMRDRIKYLLDLNKDNKFIGVVWLQGESDNGNAATHFSSFQTMTKDFFNDNGYGDRVKKGIFDKDVWYNVETVEYWYNIG